MSQYSNQNYWYFPCHFNQTKIFASRLRIATCNLMGKIFSVRIRSPEMDENKTKNPTHIIPFSFREIRTFYEQGMQEIVLILEKKNKCNKRKICFSTTSATLLVWETQSVRSFKLMTRSDIPFLSYCRKIEILLHCQGVSVVRYCECSDPSHQCPVKWDQFDGNSITQSQSDQYKVSREPPSLSGLSSLSS